MARARRKPHDPSKGDHGPSTSRRTGGYIIDTPGDKNGMKTRIFGHLLERLHADGDLCAERYTRACDIRGAIEKTEMTGGEFCREYVDSSPKPDAAITIQVDRATEYNRAMDGIPAATKSLVHDVCSGRLRAITKLEKALVWRALTRR